MARRKLVDAEPTYEVGDGTHMTLQQIADRVPGMQVVAGGVFHPGTKEANDALNELMRPDKAMERAVKMFAGQTVTYEGKDQDGKRVKETQQFPPALTRVNAVQEVAVLGATRLLTVDVSATHPLIEMGTGTLAGVMVRLRPTGLCTADDMDFAERCVRKAGALTVTRMPLADVGPDADVPGEDSPPDEELSVLPMVEALDANLRKQLTREGCSEVECEETMRLAHAMLEQAGG